MTSRLAPLLVALAVAVPGCADAEEQSAPDVSQDAGPISPTTTAPREPTAASWARPLQPYTETLEPLLSELQRAAQDDDIASIRRLTGSIADEVRNLRIALSTGGAPPAAVAVEGTAFIEASESYENAARRVAGCAHEAACLERLSEFNAVTDSFNTALFALAKKIRAD